MGPNGLVREGLVQPIELSRARPVERVRGKDQRESPTFHEAQLCVSIRVCEYSGGAASAQMQLALSFLLQTCHARLA